MSKTATMTYPPEAVLPTLSPTLSRTTFTHTPTIGNTPATGNTGTSTPAQEEVPIRHESTFWKEVSCHATLIIAGWSDASGGPLIPYIQAYYGISYTIVSMLFVGQMVGFLTAGFSNSYLTERFGLGKVITIGAVVQALGFVFLIPAFPFPVMPICYAVLGFGMALQDAQANTFIAILPNAEHKFGLLHASYGVGALVCPLAATAFASSGIKFSYFYSTSIGIAILNVIILLGAFRFNYRIPEEGRSELELETIGETGSVTSATERQDRAAVQEKSTLRRTLENKAMWLFSVFILVYVGAEVSMGGWIVTFVIDNRSGGPSAGYIATGFWAGIAIGRAALPYLNLMVGEKRIVPFYIIICAALELAIWFSKNLIGNAVTVALIGIMMGPLYPIVMSLCTKILPRSLHASGIGFIAGFGQTGSAIFPFLTGALAQKYSPAALQPVMIALFASMTAIWMFVPSVEKKDE